MVLIPTKPRTPRNRTAPQKTAKKAAAKQPDTPAPSREFAAFSRLLADLRQKESNLTAPLKAGLLKGPDWKNAQAALKTIREEIAQATSDYLAKVG